MTTHRSYDTIAEAIRDLEKRGYSADVKQKMLHAQASGELTGSNFKIEELYRFEGNTDPADESIVYAISSADGSLKGTLVNAYGIYASGATADLVKELKRDYKN